jgi:hypothetical protein
MLTTLPTYPLCESYSNEVIASVQSAFPALEAQAFNADVHSPITIGARNPLNGDCWTIIGTIGPTPRNPANIEILIGDDPRGNPVARFAGPIKKAPDSPTVCRAFVEYVKRERAKQEKEIAARQAVNASQETASKLTKQAKRVGIPIEGDTPHITISGRSGAYYERMNLPSDAVAVTLNLPTVTVTPEQAVQILKLWRPLGKFLAEMEPIKKPVANCPSTGTLVN